MAYTPPQYPAALTKASWDKNKGVVTKALGETGIGKACEDAQASFGKIDWTRFDIITLSPTGSSDEDLKTVQGLKPGVIAEHGKSVKPTIADLKALEAKATAAAAKLKKNPLTKATAKIADDMASQADALALTLALNSGFFDGVGKECDKSVNLMTKTRETVAENMKKTKEYLTALLTGLAKFSKADPRDVDTWNDAVKQQGRSVSNNLKGNPALAKKYLKTWTSKFQGFDWGTLGFADLDEATLKTKTDAFIRDVVKEATVLRADL